VVKRGLVGPAGCFSRTVSKEALALTGAESTACRQAPGHALGKDVVEQSLEYGNRKQLAGAAQGRVPGQLLVHFVAQKEEDV
jgi:hypothetical protein